MKIKKKLRVLFQMEEMNTNNNENKSETENTSVEDPLNMYRTPANETTLISETTNIINE